MFGRINQTTVFFFVRVIFPIDSQYLLGSESQREMQVKLVWSFPFFHDLNVSFGEDIVRRNQMLVTLRGKRIKETYPAVIQIEQHIQFFTSPYTVCFSHSDLFIWCALKKNKQLCEFSFMCLRFTGRECYVIYWGYFMK